MKTSGLPQAGTHESLLQAVFKGEPELNLMSLRDDAAYFTVKSNNSDAAELCRALLPLSLSLLSTKSLCLGFVNMLFARQANDLNLLYPQAPTEPASPTANVIETKIN